VVVVSAVAVAVLVDIKHQQPLYLVLSVIQLLSDLEVLVDSPLGV